MKTFADVHRRLAPAYKMGDKVWLSSGFLPTHFSANKIKRCFYGPFKIVQPMNPVMFKLQLPLTWRIHPVFHSSQLKSFCSNPFQRSFPLPPPIMVNESPEFKVQDICDSQIFSSKLQPPLTGRVIRQVSICGRMPYQFMLLPWCVDSLNSSQTNPELREGGHTVKLCHPTQTPHLSEVNSSSMGGEEMGDRHSAFVAVGAVAGNSLDGCRPAGTSCPVDSIFLGGIGTDISLWISDIEHSCSQQTAGVAGSRGFVIHKGRCKI